MRKSVFILVFICTLLLCGCASGREMQASQSLNAQVNNIEKVISSTSTNEVLDVSPYSTIDANTTTTSVQNYKITAYNNMMREEALRQDILTINASLKSYTQNPYRLNPAQSNGIIQLTKNINNEIAKFSEAKSNTQNNVKRLKKTLNNTSLNLSEIECNYISLNNNMNERYAYMSNIYSNLEQIHRILEIQKGATQDNMSEKVQTTENTDDNTTKNTKNIDTYSNASQQNNQTAQQNIPPIPQNPNVMPTYNNYYNNGYFNQGNFNPNRNTDSFYPRFRNIDTYRFNPNHYNYGYSYNNGYYNGQYGSNTLPIQ